MITNLRQRTLQPVQGGKSLLFVSTACHRLVVGNNTINQKPASYLQGAIQFITLLLFRDGQQYN